MVAVWEERREWGNRALSWPRDRQSHFSWMTHSGLRVKHLRDRTQKARVTFKLTPLREGGQGVAEVKPQVMLSAHAALVLLICFLFGLVLVWTPLLKVHSHQPPAS